jgi:hypothetical protein
MSKALGEFGKGRYSDVAHKIMQILDSVHMPISIGDMWKHVHNDLDSMETLKDLMNNLIFAGKVLSSKGGFLIKRNIVEESSNEFVDFSLLTEEERKYFS